MHTRWAGICCAAAVLGRVGTASAVTLYDAMGFESPAFSVGALDGQDGWTGGSLGGGVVPLVVTAPDPVLGQQAVRMEVGDAFEDTSLMDHDVILPSVAGQIVTVSFDIYRPAPAGGKLAQNLWWFWWDAGEPAAGLQWDIGETWPFGETPGAASAITVFDQYANLTLVWDFQQMKAFSWYNGALVDNGLLISGITELTGWALLLSHDGEAGTGGSIAFIDNLRITAVPEPASLVPAAAGALALIRRRRSR
ncbi:MAG: hypothetical protein AMXMBFR83_19600 [Phycisphaerae bacterium]